MPLYNNALKDSRFQDNVEHVESRKAKKTGPQRSRVRRITWFNPPYSKNIKTTIGQQFLRLIDRHFVPVGSKLRKIFNRSTVKGSYSCMPNMGNIIKPHNARVRGAEHVNNKATTIRLPYLLYYTPVSNKRLT